MIQIVRPVLIPARLSNQGAAITAENSRVYDVDPPAFAVKNKLFVFDHGVYGYALVKNALKNAQHEKCCYCERDQTGQYGDVEHFRPKSAYKTAAGQPLIYPGYYWLCYDWDNLLFACELCNETHKGNLFPVRVENNRARNHSANLNLEEPLLIDPTKVDPRAHIFFTNNLVDSLTEMGRQTIDICGLYRADLNDARQLMIENLMARVIIWEQRGTIPQARVNAAIQYLLAAQQPTAPFSAAAIDYLAPFDFNQP